MILTLQKIRPETSEVSTFFFTPDAPIVFKPGQHISMILPIEKPDERGKVRTFTLSSSPTEGALTITTKKGPSSFKKALFQLALGATIDCRGPGGMFYLKEENLQHVFLAGGIGITPFHSMVRYACDGKKNVQMTLLYSNKNPDEIVFKDELDAFVKKNPNLHIVYTITQPDQGTIWQGRVGRIDELLLPETSSRSPGSHSYASGPPLFVDAMLAILKALDIPEKHQHFERFTGYT